MPKTVRPGDESYGDLVAFEFFSLILDGPAAKMYVQLMSCRINWQTSVTHPDTSDQLGSFTPPSNWRELSNAVLDLLMPSNSVEECARLQASFKMTPNETVQHYALRFRELSTRFETSVERPSPGWTPWAALSCHFVATWVGPDHPMFTTVRKAGRLFP